MEEKIPERISANKKVQTRVKDLMGRMKALENICKDSKADRRLLQTNIQELDHQIQELKAQLAEKSSLDVVDYPSPGYEAYDGPTASNNNLTFLLAQMIHLKREADDRSSSSASSTRKRRSNWDILNASQRDYSKLSSYAEVAAKKARCDSLKEAEVKKITQDQSTVVSTKSMKSHVKTSNSHNELQLSQASKSNRSSKTEGRQDSFSSNNQRVEIDKKVSKDVSTSEGNDIVRKTKKKSEPSTARHSPTESQSEQVIQKTKNKSQLETASPSPKESQPEQVNKQKTPKECRICFKSFPSKKALRLHNEDKHLAVKCLKCDTVIASEIRENSGNSDYCFQCQQDQKSSTASAQPEDMSCEELEESFDCPVCQKTCKSEKRLGKHLAKHTN